jgi:hypothetical protein
MCISCPAKELSVLMIGNSFSESVLRYLPSVVGASDDCKIFLAQCGIGGCVFSRHIDELHKSQLDPESRPYWTNQGDALFGGRPNTNVPEILSVRKWDVITIQQGSHESWIPETFAPAKELIDTIRAAQPQAEIRIQQTWSYRCDDPRLLAEGSWHIDQTEMYNRLTKNYQALSREYGFRVIPTGLAVQIARRDSEIKFQPVPAEVWETPFHWPDLPRQAGDVVGQYYWRKNAETGELYMERDSIHLNRRGEYLQACVWFMSLYNKTAADIKFVPEIISNSDAAFLARCAEEAVKTAPQPASN